MFWVVMLLLPIKLQGNGCKPTLSNKSQTGNDSSNKQKQLEQRNPKETLRLTDKQQNTLNPKYIAGSLTTDI